VEPSNPRAIPRRARMPLKVHALQRVDRTEPLVHAGELQLGTRRLGSTWLAWRASASIPPPAPLLPQPASTPPPRSRAAVAGDRVAEVFPTVAGPSADQPRSSPSSPHRMDAGLTVLRISHSAVVTAWRSREDALGRAGVRSVVVTARSWEEGGRPTALVPRPGEEVVGLRTFGHHPCGFIYDPLGLARSLRRRQVDLVDLHEEPYSLAAAEVLVLRWLTRRRHLPLVVYSAQNLPKRHGLPIRLVQRAVLRRTAAAYPCNAGAAAVLRRHGFEGHLRVIGLGVDVGTFGRQTSGTSAAVTSARTHSHTEEGFRVGFAGRLVPEKGAHVALEAVLRESSWSLSVAGGGPEERRLADRAADAGASSRLDLLGAIGSSDLRSFYRSVDVLVVPSLPTPSWVEQFGRVALEAMASGTPVVASRSGALAEVVGEAGMLAPPGDADALHDCLARLARDPELRLALSRAGLARARRWSWEAVAAEQRALYDHVLTGTDDGHLTPPAGTDSVTHPPRRVPPPSPAGAGTPTGPSSSEPALPGDGLFALPPVVVVVAYHRADLLERCLGALGRPDVAPFLVVVVDNASDPSVAAVARRFGALHLDPGENLGFAAGVNRGIEALGCSDADVLLLNPDAEVDPATVLALQHRLHAEPRLAAVAPAQYDGEDRAQPVAWPFPSPARSWATATGLRLDARPDFLTGSVLLLNRHALDQVGPFDERFFLYAEETDWQRRARRAGWGVRLCADLTASHFGGATADSERSRTLLFAAGQEHYFRRWFGATGWHVARAAVVSGAALRAIVLPEPRAAAARQRAVDYLLGPERRARRRCLLPAATTRRPAPASSVDGRFAPGLPGCGLRVVHVVATDGFAGTERYVATLSAALAERGVDVVVVGGEPARMRLELERSGTVAVEYHPAASTGAAWQALRRLVPCDVVHAHMTAAETAAAAALAWRGQRPAMVATRHFAARRGRSRPGRLASVAIRARLDAQLAPSTYVAGAIDGAATVIPTGVPLAPLGPHDQPVVLVAQRFEAEKDTATAIRAWACSGLATRGWELHLAGEGSESTALVELAGHLQVSGSCRFVGRVDDLRRRYAGASLLLASAPSEPYGLSVVEAMASGLAVVATAAGGHLETAGAVSGAALFPPGDAPAAGLLLAQLAADSLRRAAYGEALQAHQRRWLDVDHFADRVLDWYLGLLRHPPRRKPTPAGQPAVGDPAGDRYG